MKERRRPCGLNNMSNYPRLSAYLLAFLLAFVLTDVADAAEAADAAGLAEAAAVAADAAQARLAARQSLQQRIDLLETESGPYAANLIEVHFDMGRMYQLESMHLEAAASFATALQLVRISEGLYSERQIGVLEQLISVNQAAEKWPDVDNNHHLLFQIKKQLYRTADSPSDNSPVDNSAWAAAVIEFGEWRLYASRSNLLRRSSSRQAQEIEEVHELYSEAINNITHASSIGNISAEGSDADVSSSGIPEKASLVSLLYGKARAEHEIAQYLMRMPPDYFAGQGSPYRVRTVCFPVAGDVAPAQNAQTVFLNASYEPDSTAARHEKLSSPGSTRFGMEISQTDTGAVRRVCTSERVENPAYRASQRNEQRMRLDRAAMNMRSTIQELHAVLEQNVSGSNDNSIAQVHHDRLAELTQMQQALVRDSRRSISRWGW